LKRLLVLVVVLVMMVVMVSSAVRAGSDPIDPTPKTSGTVSVMNSDPTDPVGNVTGVVLVDDVTLNPPPGSDIDPNAKATPILF
jgi:hypothetical protein